MSFLRTTSGKLLPVTPLISAHRGGEVVDGESALDRYRRAIAHGADFIEFDVRRTRDDISVVCHDDRTVSGRIVRECLHRDLVEELAGEALTLEELLNLVSGRVGLHMDLKETGYESDVVEAALFAVSRDKLVITGADDVIRNVKERFPEVTAGLSLGDDLKHVSPWLAPSVRLSELFPGRRIERSHADFVAAHHQLAELNVLRWCARRGIPVWVWTVDEERDIARFLRDPRVTALITNRPDVAMRIRSGS